LCSRENRGISLLRWGEDIRNQLEETCKLSILIKQSNLTILEESLKEETSLKDTPLRVSRNL
jgi:hypothetical protein